MVHTFEQIDDKYYVTVTVPENDKHVVLHMCFKMESLQKVINCIVDYGGYSRRQLDKIMPAKKIYRMHSIGRNFSYFTNIRLLYILSALKNKVVDQ
jgi:hypothetical protein